MPRVNLGEVIIKKTPEQMTDKDWVVLNSLFMHKDIAKIFDSTSPSSITGYIKRALARYIQIEHPIEQGKELMKAMEDIVERGKALKKAGVPNQMPELGLLAQVSVWTILDVIKDAKTNRQDKLRGASELRKFLETAMTMRETFLKAEAMSKVVEILKDIIGQLSPPLAEEFAKRVYQDEKLKFLLRGF